MAPIVRWLLSGGTAGVTARIWSLDKAAGAIKNVRLLGSDRPLSWMQTATALELDFRGVETGEDGFAGEIVWSF